MFSKAPDEKQKIWDVSMSRSPNSMTAKLIETNLKCGGLATEACFYVQDPNITSI